MFSPDPSQSSAQFSWTETNLGLAPSPRIEELKELLKDHSIRRLFISCISAENSSPGATRQYFQDFSTPPASALPVLKAMVTFGGVPGKTALTILNELSDSNNPEAKLALQTAYTNRGIFAGSFDPVTLGHLDLIRRAAAKCEHLIVAIGVNSAKKSTFSVAERIALIKEAVKDIHEGVISVTTFNGTLNNFANEYRANTLFRGVRAITDWDVESQQADVNLKLSESGLDTVFLPARLELTNVSSTNARLLTKLGEDLSRDVPEHVARALIRKDVEERWRAVTKELAVAESVGSEVLSNLLTQYNDPARHYHNLKHIYETLIRVDEAAAVIKEPLAVKLALFFHDAIYDTTRSDNEEQSAKLAVEELGRMGIDRSLIEKVERFILATKSHSSDFKHPDLNLFLDCDLSILAAKPKRYAEYLAGVRKEYSQYSDEQYAFGRAAFMKKFIQRESLFGSQYFSARFERLARENVAAEIRSYGDSVA